MDRPLRLVGIDAAVDPRNNALLRATYRDGGNEHTASRLPVITCEILLRPQTEEELISTLVDWCSDVVYTTVLCVDAPLGWPAPLSAALRRHRAGDPLPGEANRLFRRTTDGDVRKRVGKVPLDVGADRIARAALSTLNRIDQIGREVSAPTIVPITRDELPLESCHKEDPPPLFVLETYPAGWCASETIDTRGYRPSRAIERRLKLLSEVRRAAAGSYVVDFADASIETELARRADDLDAFLCVLAGADALSGKAPDPMELDGGCDLEVFRTEGWIWCKSRR